MNKRQVQDRVRAITRATVKAPDTAHGLEDELFFDVLNAIASGNTESPPQELARAAIEARRLVRRAR